MVQHGLLLPVKKLPQGWRKVWFKERMGILKPTPNKERRYPHNPFFERLGKTPEARGAHFGRLLMASCFNKRDVVATTVHEEGAMDPGYDSVA